MTLKKNKKIFQHIENALDHFFFLSLSKLNYFFNRDYKQYIQNAHTHTINIYTKINYILLKANYYFCN